MRRKLLFGNWKMNKTIAEAEKFAFESIDLFNLANDHDIDIGVAPTYLALEKVRKSNPLILVASQNVHFEDHGAFTGEIAIPMLQEIDINWAIIGHSERRTYDNETSEKCHQKIVKLFEADMVPIYCVGETLATFEAGETKKFVKEQVVTGIAGLDPKKVADMVIAYEPIWSIGTGKNASKEIAEDICHFIRELVKELYGVSVSESVRILYGGSVKPVNVREYLSELDIDGALVGGASLEVNSFKALIENII